MSNATPPKPDQSTPRFALGDYQLEEFKALREEMGRRSATRYQMVLAFLTLTGVIITVAVRMSADRELLLAFQPLLGWLLASIWSHNYQRTSHLAEYIRFRYERPLNYDYSWESVMEGSSNSVFRSLSSVGVVFLVTELAVGLYASGLFSGVAGADGPTLFRTLTALAGWVLTFLALKEAQDFVPKIDGSAVENGKKPQAPPQQTGP